jgi:hypothetical protein
MEENTISLEAPDLDEEDTPADLTAQDDDAPPAEQEETGDEAPSDDKKLAEIKANDIAILDGKVVEGIFRFHNALAEMTMRRGIRDEISRYEAMTMALIEPHGSEPGNVFLDFPEAGSPLHMNKFFETLYRRYDERFVIGAPSLAPATTRFRWDPDSPVFTRIAADAGTWPTLDFERDTARRALLPTSGRSSSLAAR